MIDAFKKWLAGPRGEQLADLHFEFGLLPAIPAFLLLVVVVVLVYRFYAPQLAVLPKQERRLLLISRSLLLVLAAFLLLDPNLVGYRFDPDQNYVLMLYDDSRSMTVPDYNGASRGDQLKAALTANESAFLERMSTRYRVVQYGFGSRTSRVIGPSELSFNQQETRISDALNTVRHDFSNINVAAVVVFSDGVSQPQPINPDTLSGGPPVFTVGAGRPLAWRDLELDAVGAAFSRHDSEEISARINFSAAGLADSTVLIEVLEGDRTVASKRLTIAGDKESRETHLTFKPEKKEQLVYTARVRLDPGAAAEAVADDADWVQENNSRRFLVDNREQTLNVLYFNGRPNWENKYAWRALAEDDRLDITNVLRVSSAETKFVYRGRRSSLTNPLFEGFYDQDDQPRYDEAVFLRFGGNPDMAGRGFPEKPEELFTYDLVVLSEVEVDFFSADQMAQIRDFVRKRGGALLMLGGPNSFAEGSYEGTLIANLLPVTLAEKPSEESKTFTTQFRVTPTTEGVLDGIWSLSPNPMNNDQLWRELPPIQGVNQFQTVRISATVGATVDGTNADFNGSPLFAVQRYGMGKSAILATGATWLWRTGTEVDDIRHTRFWRQMIANLAMDRPQRLMMRNKRDRYAAGANHELEFLIRDKNYNPVTGPKIKLEHIHGNKTLTVGVDESIEEAGLFTTSLIADQPGVHKFRLEAWDKEGKSLGVLEESLLVEPDMRELQQAGFQKQTLEALAATTGGSYFELNQLDQIPDAVPWIKNEKSEEVRFPLWQLPLFFVLLILIASFDWYGRRKRGLA